jgi:hypothetical protein
MKLLYTRVGTNLNLFKICLSGVLAAAVLYFHRRAHSVLRTCCFRQAAKVLVLEYLSTVKSYVNKY